MNFEQTLDNYIAAEMQCKHIPGLSLAIVKDGVAVIEKNYGLANLELQVPVASDSVFQIYSITTAFTALAILLLEEDGELKLDDPLTCFEGDLSSGWEEVTVRRLLTHTSGVSQWSLNWDHPDLTSSEIRQAIFRTPLRFVPGTEFEYVDANYNLLGMIIHQLTGAPYDIFRLYRK